MMFALAQLADLTVIKNPSKVSWVLLITTEGLVNNVSVS